MFSLVQFTDDDVHHVCDAKHIKRRSGRIVAKWKDNNFYEAKCLLSSDNRPLLKNLCENLTKKFPIIKLERSKDVSNVATAENQNGPHETSNNKDNGNVVILSTYILCQYCSCLITEDDIHSHLCTKNTIQEDPRIQEINGICEDTIRDSDEHCNSSHGHNESRLKNDVREDVTAKRPPTDLNLCMYCGLQCENLLDHLHSHELDVDELGLNDVREDVTTKTPPTDLDLCMYCGLQCENLLDHLHSHELDVDELGLNVEGDRTDIVKVKYANKQHFCVYCNTLQYKLARHLERKHSSEEDVKEALSFLKGSRQRKLLFAEIQKKGDFNYNSKNDEKIMLRRSRTGPASNGVVCPYCKGFYSKVNIRNHIRTLCLSKHEDKAKGFAAMGLGNNMVRGRSLIMNIHEFACDALKNRILPNMNDDEITRTITCDKLGIIYGNFLATKYAASRHHDNMIRSKLRLLSRILMEMRKRDLNITDVTSIFNCSNLNVFVSAVHAIAGLKEGKFESPSLGPNSVTLILQVGKILETEAAKKKDVHLENEARSFCRLLSVQAISLINKVAIENRTQHQRSKIEILPKANDIQQFLHALKIKLERYLQVLKNEFNQAAWTSLNKVVLVKLMVFNRKRPGDIEKTLIIEYKNLQKFDKDHVQQLKGTHKEAGKNFGRYITRGKLNQPATVLVEHCDAAAIDSILEHRLSAKVDEANPYVFATPQKLSRQFYSAGRALNDLCGEMGFLHKNFTATKLRKQLATATCTLDKSTQMQVSDYMGHSFAIHQNIYRQRPAQQDILEMSQLLQFASGQCQHSEISSMTAHSSSQPSVSLPSPHSPQPSTSRLSPQATMTRLSPEPSTSWLSDQHTTPPQSTTSQPKRIIQQSRGDVTNSPIHATPPQSDYDDSSDVSYVYTKDLSDISECSEGETVTVTKRKRKDDNFRVNKKHTWTTPERAAVKETFAQYFVRNNEDLPSLHTCQEFIHQNDALKNRTPSQVRSWIIQHKKRDSNGWTTPMKKKCRETFRTFYKTRKYPSGNEMETFLTVNEDFKGITIAKLRSCLQHDYDYVTKQSLFGRHIIS